MQKKPLVAAAIVQSCCGRCQVKCSKDPRAGPLDQCRCDAWGAAPGCYEAKAEVKVHRYYGGHLPCVFENEAWTTSKASRTKPQRRFSQAVAGCLSARSSGKDSDRQALRSASCALFLSVMVGSDRKSMYEQRRALRTSIPRHSPAGTTL